MVDFPAYDLPAFNTKVEDREDSGAGTIIEGALYIGFFNNGETDATVNGKKLPSKLSKTYVYVGKQYPDIAYNGNGNELLITIVR